MNVTMEMCRREIEKNFRDTLGSLLEAKNADPNFVIISCDMANKAEKLLDDVAAEFYACVTSHISIEETAKRLQVIFDKGVEILITKKEAN